MFKAQALRALVSERLAAAAEDIFVLFERTIVEYEEELSRSKEENQRNQQLLDKVLSPRIKLTRGNVQDPSTSPGVHLNQETTETPQIKEEPEEQSVKQEEEQLPVFLEGSSAVHAKIDESSPLRQKQTEHREETRREDVRLEQHFSESEGHTEHLSDADNDDDWRAPFSPFSLSTARTETGADGDLCNQDSIRDRSSTLYPHNMSALVTTVHSGLVSELEGEAERKKHQCPFCDKRFGSKQMVKRHIRVHTGEKPYSCSICMKTFAQKSNLDTHQRTHTGEKPYSCLTCEKTFALKSNLNKHMRTHTGEKPYSCSFCQKTFNQNHALTKHKRTHTGEKPFKCSHCDKTFAHRNILIFHERTHTGEKPYGCSICKKDFADQSSLRKHSRTHTGEKPYKCSFCTKSFTQKGHRDVHVRTHTGERPYGCSFCEKTFAHQRYLKTHMSTHSTEGNI